MSRLRCRSRSSCRTRGLTPAEAGATLVSEIVPPNLIGRRKTPRLVKKVPGAPTLHTRSMLTGAQRLLLLDTWRRSKLPAGDFAAFIGVSRHCLCEWKRKFDQGGPAALMDAPRGQSGSRLPEPTIRAILMLKDDNPEWGCRRISDVLSRAQGLAASAGAIANVLRENGYEIEDVPTKPHPDKIRCSERAAANQLWQTDLFTFVLKPGESVVGTGWFSIHESLVSTYRGIDQECIGEFRVRSARVSTTIRNGTARFVGP